MYKILVISSNHTSGSVRGSRACVSSRENRAVILTYFSPVLRLSGEIGEEGLVELTLATATADEAPG